MPDIAFVNGRFLPLADAVVSIDDRGFQFGDGVYEVVRTYRGRPFELQSHLTRLDRSAQALGLKQPYPHTQWTQLIHDGISRAGFSEAKVYLQITRGVAPRDHAYSEDLVPTTVMTIRELHPVSPSVKSSGVEVMTTDDIRWGRCDIKSINLLANVLARQRGKQAGVFESLLVREGLVTEGAVSNVMLIHDQKIVTAPEGPRILSGVTRAVVLRLARRDGITIEERYPTKQELFDAQEVFLTGTTVEVLGVVRIDGRQIGNGEPGPITKRLAGAFAEQTG